MLINWDQRTWIPRQGHFTQERDFFDEYFFDLDILGVFPSSMGLNLTWSLTDLHRQGVPHPLLVELDMPWQAEPRRDD